MECSNSDMLYDQLNYKFMSKNLDYLIQSNSGHCRCHQRYISNETLQWTSESIEKNYMTPFYGWGSTASRLEPLWRGSLLFTTKFSEIPGTHFINLRSRMKGWVNFGATQWFWTQDPWIGNPVQKTVFVFKIKKTGLPEYLKYDTTKQPSVQHLIYWGCYRQHFIVEQMYSDIPIFHIPFWNEKNLKSK